MFALGRKHKKPSEEDDHLRRISAETLGIVERYTEVLRTQTERLEDVADRLEGALKNATK